MRSLLLSLLLIALLAFGCQNTTPQQHRSEPVAIAVVTDPTTLEFLDEAKAANVALATKLQPRDFMWLTAVSANSAHNVEPVAFKPLSSRNRSEAVAFLNARTAFQQRVGEWFVMLEENTPPRSDILRAVALAAEELRRSQPSRKVLIVFSDMQDNISGTRKFNSSLEGIDLLVLYAFPLDRRPASYEPFRQNLLKTFGAARPRSAMVLFPTEAQTFDINNYLETVRRRVP